MQNGRNNGKRAKKAAHSGDLKRYAQIVARVDKDLYQQVETRRRMEDRSKGAFVRQALRFYLRHAGTHHNAPHA